MAYVNVITAGATVQAPPIVQRLREVFDSLDDSPLLSALQGSARRGPKGYSVKVLWRCFVAKYVMGLGSTDAMIRELHNNPYVAEVCGIQSPDAIPHKSTFSRFLFRLSRYKTAAKLKDVSRSLVRHHYATLPAFGERVAIDSTTLKGWSNGGKRKKSDNQAGWSVKQGTQGKKEYTYGYKLHIIVDCESELPISATVTPGNVHDAKATTTVLRQARASYSRFHPKFFMADAGYSSFAIRRHVKRQYQATPIILINKGHKRALAVDGEFTHTAEWKALYKQRQAVERVFSRLKGQRSLNRITVRGLRKVTAHCYLSLIALQCTHLQ